ILSHHLRHRSTVRRSTPTTSLSRCSRAAVVPSSRTAARMMVAAQCQAALLVADVELDEVGGLATRELSDAEAGQIIVEDLDLARAGRHLQPIGKPFDEFRHVAPPWVGCISSGADPAPTPRGTMKFCTVDVPPETDTTTIGPVRSKGAPQSPMSLR